MEPSVGDSKGWERTSAWYKDSKEQRLGKWMILYLSQVQLTSREARVLHRERRGEQAYNSPI